MTSLELYESFSIKLNRNDSNSNVYVPKGKFVIIFNEQAKKWLKQKLKQKLSTNELDELNTLLEDNFPVIFDKKHFDHYDYKLPDDFFDISSSFSTAIKDGCSRVLNNWVVKDKNIRELLSDSNYKPSFDYHESLCSAVNNKLKVYFDDYEIQDTYLTYYRTPTNIDIEGYINSKNEPSTTINPDLPDFALNEIVSRCALEIQGITENEQGYSVAKDRITIEE